MVASPGVPCGVSNIYVEDGKTKKAQNRHEETEKRKQR